MGTVTYEQALQVYKALGDNIIALGLSPTHASPHFLALNFKPMTLKQVAEAVLKLKLPDITLPDAIEFAKVTPFSAEDWYNGCRTPIASYKVKTK
jgi:hypothetical protein